MKRRRNNVSRPSSLPPKPALPKTPSQTLRTTHFKSTTLKTVSSISSKKPRKSLIQTLDSEHFFSGTPNGITKWVPLNLGKRELSLPLTLPTGQTFRWKETGPLQYTGVVKSHLVSLRHLDNGDVAFHFHNNALTGSCGEGEGEADAKLALLDYLNMDICLADLWEEFSALDERFAELAKHLGGGARVLRQDPLECLLQFLCSSNNNIGRITRMVDYISSLGNHLGTVQGFDFHEFPSIERLAMVSEEELRKAGFGYRAKYITRSVKLLQSKPGGGLNWLSSLRSSELEEVINSLCTLPGVGPKVAACVALFSLDQHHAIPVDTHVWKVATRYLIPELASVRPTLKLSSRVLEAFTLRYGKYAGWAQTLLFIAELPSQKALIPSQVLPTEERKTTARKGKFEDDTSCYSNLEKA